MYIGIQYIGVSSNNGAILLNYTRLRYRMWGQAETSIILESLSSRIYCTVCGYVMLILSIAYLSIFLHFFLVLVGSFLGSIIFGIYTHYVLPNQARVLCSLFCQICNRTSLTGYVPSRISPFLTHKNIRRQFYFLASCEITLWDADACCPYWLTYVTKKHTASTITIYVYTLESSANMKGYYPGVLFWLAVPKAKKSANP